MDELTKLFLILGGGLFVIIIGFIVQKLLMNKKNELEDNIYSSDYNSQNNIISQEEEIAKKYIQDYKLTYPRDSIKQGLLQINISEEKSEEYLNKYF